MFLDRMDPHEALAELLGLRSAGQTPTAVLERRVRVLSDLVLRLLVEVEALRENEVRRARAAGAAGPASGYGDAYRDTALLTHNAAGPSSGLDKLLGEWLPRAGEAHELRMLRRLGFTAEEIERHAKEARDLESLS